MPLNCATSPGPRTGRSNTLSCKLNSSYEYTLNSVISQERCSGAVVRPWSGMPGVVGSSPEAGEFNNLIVEMRGRGERENGD